MQSPSSAFQSQVSPDLQTVQPQTVQPQTVPTSYLVFSQHGMVDTSVAMAALAQRVSGAESRIIAPNLGYWNTFLSIEPLIAKVEAVAQNAFDRYPHTQARIIACSLGGVIWTEVLTRHPEWWFRVESFVLLGSPIGGAHLAKIADPLSILSFGIAKDLGIDRRSKAEAIAQEIPTLIIAGESQPGGDGTVLVQSTKFKGAQFVLLPGVNHPGLRFSDAVDAAIQRFWKTSNSSHNHHVQNYHVQNYRSPSGVSQSGVSQPLLQAHSLDPIIETLRSVPGMTDAPPHYLKYAKLKAELSNGGRLLTWSSPIGVKFVFLENSDGQYCFGGYVGLIHHRGLNQAIKQLLIQ